MLALVAANPLSPAECPTLQRIRQQPRSTDLDAKLKVKTTVIMTSVSLLGQWEDECRKHAPGLRVGRYHPGSNKHITSSDLQHLDVVVSTSTFRWDGHVADYFKFHRIVVDESHLLSTAPSSARLEFAVQKDSDLRWCVTATPITASIAELRKRLTFLSAGFDGQFFHHESIRAAVAALQGNKPFMDSLMN